MKPNTIPREPLRTRKLALLAFIFTLLAAPPAAAETARSAKKPLTLENIATLVPPGISELSWRDSRRLTYVKPARPGGRAEEAALFEFDAVEKRESLLLAAVPIPNTPKALSPKGAIWNPSGTALLLNGENDLWLYLVGAKSLTRLTEDEAEEDVPTFSPDGSRIAFVKRGDLFVIDLGASPGRERRLTKAENPHIWNGRLDWVYEEELAQRKSGRSYEWAPDSQAIAYLRLDENRVPEFPLVDFSPVNGRLLSQRYPKAGDPNAIPSVHVVEVGGPNPVESVHVEFANEDIYIAPEFSWTPDSKAVSFLKLNREQIRLDVLLAPRGGGPLRTLLVENDYAWINSLAPPLFLPDGSGFVFLSERSGFLHLYRHAMDGALRNAITSGAWMVEDGPSLDAGNGLVYFTATEKDPRERQTYRVRLDGTGQTRLTEGRGVHTFLLAPEGRFLTDAFSTIEAPPRTLIRSSSGVRIASVDDPPNQVGEYALGSPELMTFTGRDGTLFYGRLLKPPDFDPTKKYPVITLVYGGPHEQLVRDRWTRHWLFDHLCASKGFLVFTMDNRGSWGRGHAFETPILRKMGEVELSDQLEGVAYLKSLPYVDSSRLGIWGWSYGGYLALYAATHAGETYKCAIAGAPVVDWKYYDSIYTERYMKLPRSNPAGYKASSPLAAAERLGTKLLVLHGTADDNVHMQNSIALFEALIQAGKDFGFVPLPGQKHSVAEAASLRYRNRRILEFFEKNL